MTGAEVEVHDLTKSFRTGDTTITAVDGVTLSVSSGALRQAGQGGRAARGGGARDRADATPARLSGGEQQRVAIARALIGRPTLLLADEPTGNLDPTTSAEILDLLLGLRDEYGMTIVVATHERQVAARCDRMVRLRAGRVVDEVDLTTGHPPENTLARITALGG
jgi:putative ABC transport system ATP-binding protein